MTSSSHPTVSVIIPNWNGKHLLPACLDSLRGQTFRDFETVVVDNGSKDGSVELLREQYPEVRLLALPINRFFAGAVNHGIKETRSPIVALLNNDAEAEPAWLEALVHGLANHPRCGMAASKILLYDRPDVLNSAGDFVRLDGIPGNRGVWERDLGQYDDQTDVFGACAGAAAYRRSLFDEIGYFDEEYLAYCEDVDLNFRARLAGFECVFVPEARVHHRLSATGGGPLASYLCGRNFIRLAATNMPGSLIRRYWPRIVLAQLKLLGESLRHFREPAARARVRGQLAGLASLTSVGKKRRVVQSLRKVPDVQIEALLAAADHPRSQQ
ncbi:MAG: glycosyltransferase family 2 protein [Chloroflexota bacterium]|nr:MAG: glycosyltransferase family 2 protein [Chloroflexota bacterium]